VEDEKEKSSSVVYEPEQDVASLKTGGREEANDPD